MLTKTKKLLKKIKNAVLYYLSYVITPSDIGKNKKHIHKIRFILRTFWFPILTFKLIYYIANHHNRGYILHWQPGFPYKLHRPYLSLALSGEDRLKGIISHYSNQLISNDLIFNREGSKNGAVIACFQGSSGSEYLLRFYSSCGLDKEGELTFSINHCGNILAKITFTIMSYSGQDVLFIGGIQGGAPGTAHDQIKQATKECYGAFPKRIVIEAIRAFSIKLNINRIVSVSNKTHVYSSKRYMTKKKDVFLASYDTFLESIGGEIDSNDHYIIPINSVSKSLDDIPSKKRAQYKRKQELLALVFTQVYENVLIPPLQKFKEKTMIAEKHSVFKI
ncbi:VirK/YbjX family protein [Ewingella sp. S1.OA.A_B6]